MPPLSDADRQKAADLIEQIQDDGIQSKLKGGFERDFANSVVAQWDRSQYLSARQLEILEDLVGRYIRAPGGSALRRRYEGFGR